MLLDAEQFIVALCKSLRLYNIHQDIKNKKDEWILDVDDDELGNTFQYCWFQKNGLDDQSPFLQRNFISFQDGDVTKLLSDHLLSIDIALPYSSTDEVECEITYTFQFISASNRQAIITSKFAYNYRYRSLDFLNYIGSTSTEEELPSATIAMMNDFMLAHFQQLVVSGHP